MIDINKLFAQEGTEAVKFYNEEHNLTDPERLELHDFFDATYKTTLTAKSIFGLAAGFTMAYIAKKKVRVRPMYPLMGGIIISAVAYQYMTPAIFDNKLLALEKKVGKDSPVYRVVKVTPEAAEYSYYWSQYFETSIAQPEVRLKNPNNSDNFTDSAVPFGSIEREDHLIENKGVEGSAWDKVRHEK